MITNKTIFPLFIRAVTCHIPPVGMDGCRSLRGESPCSSPARADLAAAGISQLTKLGFFFNSGLNSLTHRRWRNLNNLLVMKSETPITISSYKHQFCSGEVSGPLFLNLARFQNYWRTTSKSLDSSFDFTLSF